MRTAFLAVLLAFAGAAHGADAPAPLRLNLVPSDLRVELDRAKLATSAIEHPIEPRTAVSYKLAPDGVTGQAGYLCGLGVNGPPSDPAPGGPASAYGRTGTFLGASLALPIR